MLTGGKTNLISQGTYGCIFRPGFHCNGRAINSDKYITKIQKKKGTSDHEAEIGEIIRKIPHYDEYFAPILEKPCMINMASIHENEIKKCEFLKTISNAKAPFESNKIKYVGKHTLADSLLEEYHKQPTMIIKKIAESHIHLLNGYKKLNDTGIIHFDVKENNIICEDIKKTPIIIDFGLSLNMNHLKMEKLPNMFFVYGPDYAPWTIEIAVISYIVQELSGDWRKQIIKRDVFHKIVDDYCKQNYALIDLLSDSERKTFRTEMKAFFDNYMNKTGEEVVKELLNLKQTWDNYAVAVIYLYIIKDMHIDKYIEHSKQLFAYVSYLINMLVSVPNKRPTIQDTKKQIITIFNQVNRIENKKVGKQIMNNKKEHAPIIAKNIDNTKSKHLKQEEKIYKEKNI